MARRSLQSFLALMCFLFALAEEDERKTYQDDKLVQLTPTTEEQVALLRDIELKENVDFWTQPKKNSHVDVHVESQNYGDFINRIKQAKIHHTLLSNDLQTNIDEEQVQMQVIANQQSSSIVGTYPRHDQINTWLMEMAMTYPDLASVDSIGQTWEGRETEIIKLGKEGPTGTDKPIIWIEAGIHAREWISPATAVYIINKLLMGYGVDSTVTSLMDMWDIHIVPTVNPDGYEFSHTKDRLWRKNRRPRPRGGPKRCAGVDCNRNFDIDFGGAGTSTNLCSDVYPGTSAFSEKETQNIRDAVMADASRIKIYLAWHSYSQLLLIPWTYKSDKPADYSDLLSVADTAANALHSVYGTHYTVGTGPDILYPASGVSVDWVKAMAGVKYSYAYEFRPASSGGTGFILPPEEIAPNSEEVFASLVVMANEVWQTL